MRVEGKAVKVEVCGEPSPQRQLRRKEARSRVRGRKENEQGGKANEEEWSGKGCAGQRGF